jgi:hypothetical protein
MHKSHASGRDIDIFYFASDADGLPMHGLPAMLHFASDGHAVAWSAGKVGRPIKDPLPNAHFDARRNWAWCAPCSTTRSAKCSGSSSTVTLPAF